MNVKSVACGYNGSLINQKCFEDSFQLSIYISYNTLHAFCWNMPYSFMYASFPEVDPALATAYTALH